MNVLRARIVFTRFSYIVFTFSFTALLMLTWSGVASAARNDWCSNSPSYPLPANPGNFPSGGRNGCIGYFTGDDMYDPTSDFLRGGNVLYSTTGSGGPAILALNAGQFIKQMEDYLNEGSPTKYTWNAAGAAFIIDNMLGEPGGNLCTGTGGHCTWSDGIRYAENNLTAGKNWVKLVKDYETAGRVQWSVPTSLPKGMKDSQHACIGQVGVYCADDTLRAANPQWDERDVAFRRNNVNSFGDLIVFQNPNGSVFRIRRDCGNVVGAVQALASIPISVTCGGSSVPPIVDPQQGFNVTLKLTYSPTGVAAVAFGPDTMNVKLVNNATGATIYSTSKTPVAPFTGGVATITTGLPATGQAGNFTVYWQSSGSQDPLTTAWQCHTSLTAANKPYFTVGGGDMAAGPGFCGLTVGKTDSEIDGFNNAGAGYFGAGSQLGALATGGITAFATNTTNDLGGSAGISSNGVAGDKPSGLAFANTGVSSPTYGGNYGRTNWCVDDYAGKVTGTTAGAPASLNSSGNYTVNGPYVFNGGGPATIGNGAHITIVVKGDVYIGGNIQYAPYTTVAGIPQLKILVQNGNIYVGSNVTQLSGFYDAEPNNSGNNGIMYTCSQRVGTTFTYLTGDAGDGSVNATKDVANYYSRCGSALTFYGAVSARQLKLGRTQGSIVPGGGVTNVPAEKFVYTPELWLGNLSAPNCASAGGCTYQAYTGLPPVL